MFVPLWRGIAFICSRSKASEATLHHSFELVAPALSSSRISLDGSIAVSHAIRASKCWQNGTALDQERKF